MSRISHSTLTGLCKAIMVVASWAYLEAIGQTCKQPQSPLLKRWLLHNTPVQVSTQQIELCVRPSLPHRVRWHALAMRQHELRGQVESVSHTGIITSSSK
mmetsp:Transcript_11869/g.19999  ORF Transcript_11869/g.19999 Transcript_11869/m.19999 type:complete len:100 (-) Transcript_11869:245-544(-)